MARIDATAWIPEEFESKVLRKVNAQSAIEDHARRVPMATDSKEVPRSGGVDVEVVSKGTAYGEAADTLDTVVLKARKFGKIFVIAEEDLNDSLPDVLETFRLDWATSFARMYDHACLGTDGAETGVARPFTSVYQEVTTNAPGNHTLVYDGNDTTPGPRDLTYDDLSAHLSLMENGDYFDQAELVYIANPVFRGHVRGIKDGNGRPIFVENPRTGEPDTLFGHPVKWSFGAAVDTAATDSPTGNPLLIAGNKQFLLNGIRSGPESRVSYEASFETDEPKLKVRARRGFAVGRAEAFAVLEKQL